MKYTSHKPKAIKPVLMNKLTIRIPPKSKINTNPELYAPRVQRRKPHLKIRIPKNVINNNPVLFAPRVAPIEKNKKTSQEIKSHP